MKGMIAVAAVVAVVLAALLISRLQPAEELPVLAELPAFELTSSRGEAIALSDLHGSVWVANFIFTTCPSFCPRLSEQMKSLQRRLAGVADVRLVSISVDPATDTPERLRAYAERYGADPDRWLFLTGARRAVYELVRDGFMLAVTERSPEEAADGEGVILHSDRFVLVDREGRVRGYYRGTEDEAIAELGDAAAQLAAGD